MSSPVTYQIQCLEGRQPTNSVTSYAIRTSYLVLCFGIHQQHIGVTHKNPIKDKCTAGTNSSHRSSTHTFIQILFKAITQIEIFISLFRPDIPAFIESQCLTLPFRAIIKKCHIKTRIPAVFVVHISHVLRIITVKRDIFTRNFILYLIAVHKLLGSHHPI